MDDPLQVTQYTVRELSYHKHKNWNISLKINDRMSAWSMLTAGMSARDIAQHFQRPESTISRLLNRFRHTGNIAD